MKTTSICMHAFVAAPPLLHKFIRTRSPSSILASFLCFTKGDPGSMAQPTGQKKRIEIDVISDTVCPWCYVAKKNLEKAMDSVKKMFDFEVRWHQFFLNAGAQTEGIKKSEFYIAKFGAAQYDEDISWISEAFRDLGLHYDTSGLTGNTLRSHRLISFAASQGYAKQNALVEELFHNYLCEGKFIGDKQVLLDAARKVGVEGAEELLEDEGKGMNAVVEELQKYSSRIIKVPHFVINGRYELGGAQPPEEFLKAFEAVDASDV